MNLTRKFQEAWKSINSVVWIALFPIVSDIFNLLMYNKIYKVDYNPKVNILTLKIGFIDDPPSIRYLLEDFPSVLLQYQNGSFRGIINGITLSNISLAITALLITSFFHSLYLHTLEGAGRDSVNMRNLFAKANGSWHKFFIFDIITITPIALMLIHEGFIVIGFLNVIFVYVTYSFVVDEGSIIKNFGQGTSMLFTNLGTTIKMAFYYGFIFSIISVLIYVFSSYGKVGIIISIIIVGYMGLVINKAVLECYRGFVNGENEKNDENEDDGNQVNEGDENDKEKEE